MKPIVILDAGHGGRDPGAVGPAGMREKDVTLAVCLEAGRILAPVADVRYTRTDDRDFGPAGRFDASVCIGARGRIVNASGARVCVSVHCNSSVNRTAHGVETFRHQNKPGDQRLAVCVQKRLVAATGRVDRGVKTANFGMIRIPTMPAALVELPFISNPDEERLLRDPGFQARCARAIAEGIAEFLELEAGLLEKVKIRVEDGGRQQVVEGILIDGVTYAPVRAVAETLGRQVNWDQERREVVIK